MLDSRQKRAAVVGVGRAWYRNPHPSNIDAAQRASIAQVYPVAVFQGVAAPVFAGTIPDISLEESASTTDYDLSTYFTGATSYSIAPAVETGWTFNTSTGVLTVLPDTVGTFGTYVVTGANAGGTADSNAFGVTVTEVSVGGGSSDPARHRRKETKQEILRRKKFYRELDEARRLRASPPKEAARSVQKTVKRPILHLVKPSVSGARHPRIDSKLLTSEQLTEELRLEFAEQTEELNRLEMLRKQNEALLLLLID